jgi:hypothetical protein
VKGGAFPKAVGWVRFGEAEGKSYPKAACQEGPGIVSIHS